MVDDQLCRVQVFDKAGKFKTMWGQRGKGPGEFDMPRGVAVDEDGLIFVADSRNDRVQVFAPDGAYVRSLGFEGTGGGQLRIPASVAVLPNGDVAISEYNNNRISLFREGYFLRCFPHRHLEEGFVMRDAPQLASDLNGSLILLNHREGRLVVVSSHGSVIEGFAFERMTGVVQGGLAVDGEGKVLVTDFEGNRVLMVAMDTSRHPRGPPSTEQSPLSGQKLTDLTDGEADVLRAGVAAILGELKTGAGVLRGGASLSGYAERCAEKDVPLREAVRLLVQGWGLVEEAVQARVQDLLKLRQELGAVHAKAQGVRRELQGGAVDAPAPAAEAVPGMYNAYVNGNGWASIEEEGRYTGDDPGKRTWRLDEAGILSLHPGGGQLFGHPEDEWCAQVAPEGEGANTDPARRTWTLDEAAGVLSLADGRGSTWTRTTTSAWGGRRVMA